MRRGGSKAGLLEESQLPGQGVLDRPDGTKKAKETKKASTTSAASLQNSIDSYI